MDDKEKKATIVDAVKEYLPKAIEESGIAKSIVADVLKAMEEQTKKSATTPPAPATEQQKPLTAEDISKAMMAALEAKSKADAEAAKKLADEEAAKKLADEAAKKAKKAKTSRKSTDDDEDDEEEEHGTNKTGSKGTFAKKLDTIDDEDTCKFVIHAMNNPGVYASLSKDEQKQCNHLYHAIMMEVDKG